MANTISPNMGLVIPGIGTESSPNWAQDLNSSLSSIDTHNHSPSQGVQIQPNGLNINSDLLFQSNNAIQLRSVIFTPQSAVLSLSTDVGSIYVVGNELYYNDVTGGHNVQLTSNGSVNATSSGISSGTATASFVSSILVVNAAANTPANIQAGSILLGNNSAGTNFLTLSPPPAMPANYTVTLPSLPGSTLPLSIGTSGNITANQITTTQITTQSITQPLLALKTLNSTVVAVGGIGVSPSSGAYIQAGGQADIPVTNLTMDITTTGRPVYIAVQPDGTTNASRIIFSNTTFPFIITRNGSPIATIEFSSSVPTSLPVGGIAFIDASPSAGTYTYAVLLTTTSATVEVDYCSLVVYEI